MINGLARSLEIAKNQVARGFSGDLKSEEEHGISSILD